MTCDSLECYYESKRVERRIRRLRALADGYRRKRTEREQRVDMLFRSIVGFDPGEKLGPWIAEIKTEERARIVAKMRGMARDTLEHGPKSTSRKGIPLVEIEAMAHGIKCAADEIERGE